MIFCCAMQTKVSNSVCYIFFYIKKQSRRRLRGFSFALVVSNLDSPYMWYINTRTAVFCHHRALNYAHATSLARLSLNSLTHADQHNGGKGKSAKHKNILCFQVQFKE